MVSSPLFFIIYYFVFLFAFLHIFSICKITEVKNKIKKLYQLLKKSYTFHLLYSLTYLNNFSHKMTFQNISYYIFFHNLPKKTHQSTSKIQLQSNYSSQHEELIGIHWTLQNTRGLKRRWNIHGTKNKKKEEDLEVSRYLGIA